MKSSELLRLLRKDGWYEVRKRGSHIIMQHPVKRNYSGPVPCLQRSQERPAKIHPENRRNRNNQKIMTMKKPKVTLNIIKEDRGYSAVGKWKDRLLATQGDHWDDLQKMIVEMVNLTFEDLGYAYTLEDIALTYDLESFFDFYKVINAKALSERIGMNQSLLAQYIKGIKKPSVAQTKRILKGVQQIGRELTEVRFLLQ